MFLEKFKTIVPDTAYRALKGKINLVWLNSGIPLNNWINGNDMHSTL